MKYRQFIYFNWIEVNRDSSLKIKTIKQTNSCCIKKGKRRLNRDNIKELMKQISQQVTSRHVQIKLEGWEDVWLLLMMILRVSECVELTLLLEISLQEITSWITWCPPIKRPTIQSNEKVERTELLENEYKFLEFAAEEAGGLIDVIPWSYLLIHMHPKKSWFYP